MDFIKNENKIYIYLEKEHSFKHQPIVQTLIEGFQILNYQTIYKNDKYFWEMNTGDIFIWIAMNWNKEKVPWIKLKEKGIYIIYYQTEPLGSGMSHPYEHLNEVWDYSCYNIMHFKKKNSRITDNLKYRFVPPGYFCNECVQYKSKKDNKIVLFGSPKWRKSSWKIVTECFINENLENRLIAIYNVWDEEKYISFIQESFVSGIFINILKPGCGNILTSVRFSKLLSSKAIIISERCQEIDEVKYQGIVDFVDLKNIVFKCKEYLKMTAEERKTIANKRFQLFKNRFSSKNIFYNANIQNLFL